MCYNFEGSCFLETLRKICKSLLIIISIATCTSDLSNDKYNFKKMKKNEVYIEYKAGPKIEPCGTHDTMSLCELVLETTNLLSVRLKYLRVANFIPR